MSGLALLSTLGGNLLLTGATCNIIVAERAAAQGASMGFADFARPGISMTFRSPAIAVAWLWAAGLMQF